MQCSVRVRVKVRVRVSREDEPGQFRRKRRHPSEKEEKGGVALCGLNSTPFI